MILFSNPAALRLYAILYDKTSYALLKLSPKNTQWKNLHDYATECIIQYLRHCRKIGCIIWAVLLRINTI